MPELIPNEETYRRNHSKHISSIMSCEIIGQHAEQAGSGNADRLRFDFTISPV
jgi:alanyl-tRNA synthetase